MTKKSFLPALTICLLFFSLQQLKAKPAAYLYGDTAKKYIPGKSYLFKLKNNGEEDKAIEYIAGDPNSKLILTSPHGGDLKPGYLHTRSKDFEVPANDNEFGDAESFSGTSDTKTLELTLAIADEIKRKTGIRPHIVLNRLHRSKLDPNRAIGMGAQGDQQAETAWKAFHQYIEDAKAQVAGNGEGLLLDIHGNAHRPQRTEVGYLLRATDFDAKDLEKFASKSSIRAMVKPGRISFKELVTGENALGTLLNNDVFMATPGKANPFPADTLKFPDKRYFNGGYITARHGSKMGGQVSAIQLEFNQEVRVDDNTRNAYARSIGGAVCRFMELYFK